MASLIEELISTLEEEDKIYKEVLPVTSRKTQAVIENDLDTLQNIIAQEQELIDKINTLEHKREEVVLNVATVLGKEQGSLNVKKIIEILDGQPKEQRKLSLIHDSLVKTVQTLMEINSRNESLIKQSLEMIEFNMNFIQSTRMSPGNNYTKGAAVTDTPLSQTGMFDAKQ